uniref:TNF family profile domain-containing protein n=1 Tax=Gopherus agassizii TaxID=38772 RepID=A0A452H0F1_9SAUR
MKRTPLKITILPVSFVISLLSLFLPMPKPHKIILFQEGSRDSHLHGFLFASSTPDYVPKEKRINISWNRGTMNVRNLSIPIYCDGFYLVSLKGTIKAMSQRNASLSLKVYKRSDASILCVKVTEEVIDSVTVSEMRFKDEVYLENVKTVRLITDIQYQGMLQLMLHAQPEPSSLACIPITIKSLNI